MKYSYVIMVKINEVGCIYIVYVRFGVFVFVILCKVDFYFNDLEGLKKVNWFIIIILLEFENFFYGIFI